MKWEIICIFSNLYVLFCRTLLIITCHQIHRLIVRFQASHHLPLCFYDLFSFSSIAKKGHLLGNLLRCPRQPALTLPFPECWLLNFGSSLIRFFFPSMLPLFYHYIGYKLEHTLQCMNSYTVQLCLLPLAYMLHPR